MNGNSHRRVAVTGVGPLSSIGIGRDAFWKAALEGRSGTRAVDCPWMDREMFTSHVGAPVQGFEPERFGIGARERRTLDPVTRFALAAARLALEDAGIPLRTENGRRDRAAFFIEEIDARRVAVVVGTGMGGLETIEICHGQWSATRSRAGINRFSLPMLIPNAVPAQIAIHTGARGECKTMGTACAAGTMATGDAYRLIRDGEADLAIAGGVEATMSDHDGFALMGFDLLKTASLWRGDPASASRPFDRDRQGFVLSEGAGILILEELEHARARGAHVYAEIAGYHATCDAHSMLQLSPSGDEIVRVMTELLERGDTATRDVTYINAHGTGTEQNDPLETAALRRVFGSHADDLMVTGTKSMTGHAIAASGGLEAIATALTLDTGRVHPTINLDNPDPACDLDYVPWKSREARVEAALSCSYGFGGHNAALLMRAV